MKCWACGKEFGTETRIELVTICETQRYTPIIGIQQKIGKDCLWEMDYEEEKVDDGEIVDKWYICSFCGETIPEDNVESIVRSYKMEI